MAYVGSEQAAPRSNLTNDQLAATLKSIWENGDPTVTPTSWSGYSRINYGNKFQRVQDLGAIYGKDAQFVSDAIGVPIEELNRTSPIYAAYFVEADRKYFPPGWTWGDPSPIKGYDEFNPTLTPLMKDMLNSDAAGIKRNPDVVALATRKIRDYNAWLPDFNALLQGPKYNLVPEFQTLTDAAIRLTEKVPGTNVFMPNKDLVFWQLKNQVDRLGTGKYINSKLYSLQHNGFANQDEALYEVAGQLAGKGVTDLGALQYSNGKLVDTANNNKVIGTNSSGFIKFGATADGDGWTNFGFTMVEGVPIFATAWEDSSDWGDIALAASIALAFVPGVGQAVGAAILPAGASATAATLVGNTLIQTILNKGDIEAGIKSAVAQYAGAQVGGMAGEAFSNLAQTSPALVTALQAGASGATRAVLLGQSPAEAIKSAAVNGVIGLVSEQIPGFGDLNTDVKNSIKAAAMAAAYGGDASEILANGLSAAAITYGVSQIPEYDKLDQKYKDIIKNSIAQGVGSGDFDKAALSGIIAAASTYGAEVFNRDRVTQALKDNGQLPTADYDKLTFDEQQTVDNILANNKGFLLTSTQANNAIKDYLYTDAADVAAAFEQYFSDTPSGMTKAEYYGRLVDLGVIDGFDDQGRPIASLADIGASKSLVDDRFSQLDIDLNSALQFDPDLDLGVVQQIYGYNNAEDALAGYLERVNQDGAKKVISNIGDFNAAVEVVNSISKYPNGDPLDAFNEAKDAAGLTPEVIDALFPDVGYDNFIQRLDGAYLTSDEVTAMYEDKLGRAPTGDELAAAVGSEAWNLERSLQVQADYNKFTYDSDAEGKYSSLQASALAAMADGYSLVRYKGKLYDLNNIKKPVAPSDPMPPNLQAASQESYKNAILDSKKYTGKNTSDQYDAAKAAWTRGFQYYTYNGKNYAIPQDMDTMALQDAINESESEYSINEIANSKVVPDGEMLNFSDAKALESAKDNVVTAVRQYEAAAKSGDSKAQQLYLENIAKAQLEYDKLNRSLQRERDVPQELTKAINANSNMAKVLLGASEYRDLIDSDFYSNGTFVGLKAASGLAETINSIVMLAAKGAAMGSGPSGWMPLDDKQLEATLDLPELNIDSTALYEWAQKIDNLAEDKLSLEAKIDRAEYLQTISDADGLPAKMWAAAAGAFTHPLGFSVVAGPEFIEEGLTFAVSGGLANILKAGYKAQLGFDTVFNMGESFAGGYDATKQAILAQGGSAELAESKGVLSGLLDAGITGILNPIFDKALIKGIVTDTAKNLFKSAPKILAGQYAEEALEGGLQNAEQQYVQTGKIDVDQVYDNAALEGMIGAATAAGILSAGTAIKYGDQLLSTYKKNNPGAPIDFKRLTFEAPNGTTQTFGQLGAQVFAADEDGGQWVDLMPVEMAEDIRYNVDFELDAQTGVLRDVGITGRDPAEWAGAVADVKTRAEGEQKLLEWADPLYLSYDEAEEHLKALGYEGTVDEVEDLLQDNGNAVPEAEAETRIDQYVDEHTVTADELRDQLLAENPTLTEEEIQAYTQQGANVNQDQVIANAVASVDSTYRTEQEVRDRFADLGLNQITDTDAARFAGDVAEGDSFDSDAEAYLPTAAQNLFVEYIGSGELATKESVTDAIKTYMQANPGISLDDVRSALNTYFTDNPQLTSADVKSVVTTALADYATTDDVSNIVNTALENTVGTFPTEDNPAGTGLIADLIDQGATIEEIQAALGDPEEGTGVYQAIAEAQGDATQAAEDYINAAIGAAPTEDNPEGSGLLGELYAETGRLGEEIGDVQDAIGQPGDTLEDGTVYGRLTDLGLTDEQILGVIGNPATDTEDATGLYKFIDESSEDAVTAANEYLDTQLGSAPTEDNPAGSGILGQIFGETGRLGEEITDIQDVIGTPTTDEAEGTGIIKTLEDLGASADQIAEIIGTPATDTEDATGLYQFVEQSSDDAVTAANQYLDLRLGSAPVEDDPSTPDIDESAPGSGLLGELYGETGRLGEDIADVGADVTAIQNTLGVPAEYDEDGNLVSDATGFYKQFKDLGFRDQEILGVIGLPATEESESTGLYKTIDEASQRGIDAVDALGQIVGYPASVDENGDVVESTGLFGVLDAVQEQNEEQYGDLTRQNQELSNLLGKPAQDITQADIDMLNQMVSGDVETDTAYDANQDGVIDQSDIDILTGVLAGTNVDWQAPEESYWAPTGVYGEMAAMEARQLAQAQEANRQAAIRSTATQARQTLSDLIPQAQQMAQNKTTYSPIYGGQSMGFTPGGAFNPLAFRGFLRGQDKPGGNKMAQGGYVEDDFDDLLRMLQD